MSERARFLAEEFEFAFARLKDTMKDVDEKEYHYSLTEKSNSISVILNHISRITNLNMPRIITGDSSYMPEGWPSDYVEHNYGIEKLMNDIEIGKKRVIDGVAGLSDEELDEVIQMMSGPYPRKIGLFAYVGELFHHRGQIAFIRGSIKRLRENDPDLLK
jgi:uncharacterized damage-inducible protein DinB